MSTFSPRIVSSIFLLVSRSFLCETIFAYMHTHKASFVYQTFKMPSDKMFENTICFGMDELSC